MQVPTFFKRQVLVKDWSGCIGVWSGMVTSIGFPGAAWSHRMEEVGEVTDVGDGWRVGGIVEVAVGVWLVIPLSVVDGVAGDGVRAITWVRRACTVW